MNDMKIRSCVMPLCLGLAGLSASLLMAAPPLAQTPTLTQNSRPVFPKYVPKKGPIIEQPKGAQYWAEQRKEMAALTNKTWAHEQWTGDDAPYAALRAHIEQAKHAGQPPMALLSQYAAPAKKEPNNPLAQFAWAYAVRLAVSATPASKTMSDLRFAAEIALAEAPLPHTYNYDRLRYLLFIQGAGGLPSYFLKDLGARLLQRNPQDFPVLLAQSIIFTQNPDKVAQQHGYMLIQEMIKKYPDKLEVYDMLGSWYSTQYRCYHNPDSYREALTFYRKALAMYPALSARRADLPAVMSSLTARYHQISGG